MVRRNKELEQAALMLLSQEEGEVDIESIQDADARREEADIELAKQISMGIEDDRARQMATEEEELQRAIEESKKEFEGEQARIKAEEMRKEEE